MKLNKRRRENCKELADALMSAFAWRDSKEGYDYWNKVHMKLEQYANSNSTEYCKECGKEVDEE